MNTKNWTEYEGKYGLVTAISYQGENKVVFSAQYFGELVGEFTTVRLAVEALQKACKHRQSGGTSQIVQR